MPNTLSALWAAHRQDLKRLIGVASFIVAMAGGLLCVTTHSELVQTIGSGMFVVGIGVMHGVHGLATVSVAMLVWWMTR